MYWFEVVGAILSLIYLYLSIKQKASLWIFGFLASAMYIVVFWESKFYADMSLQFYYLFISVYGWLYWKEKENQPITEMPIAKVSKRTWIKLTFFGGIIYLIYLIVLDKYTDSTIPYSDSLVGMLSVIGTWMLAKKYIENWLVWIVADSIACGLFFYKELYVTAFLFVIYTVMAIVGYLQWKRNL